jgi:1-acyl-sn-glycerol-3-phosphate acyltransferase
MSETDLERRLFGSCVGATFARPDYGRIHQELRRKGVTIMLLWQEYSARVDDEYCAENPIKALRYSQFSENYRQFAKRLKRSMRQSHRAGEKMFIDYAGQTVPYGDEGDRGQIYVAALGASNYTFACATERQRLEDWSGALVRHVGLALHVSGTAPRPGATLVVANHVSFLDIAAIHAAVPQARFVSKADVLAWPLLGWLIKNAGTLFIERERKRDAVRVVHAMAESLQRGETVAVFPEGTTGPGDVPLAFHANLLQAAIATGTGSGARLVPSPPAAGDAVHSASHSASNPANCSAAAAPVAMTSA